MEINSAPSAEVPSFYESLYPNNWQMFNWEKHTFISLMQQLKPQVAIEIGNAEGGSLQVLDKLVPKVYALDLCPENHDKLKTQFPHVEFHTGDSKKILPGLLKSIQQQNEKLGFIFIDGDHTTEGVRADINAILDNYIPVTRLVILFHDSFNPDCRKGILSAGWQNCSYVHSLAIDYAPGNYGNVPHKGKMRYRTMWGGFAMAVLEPQQRNHTLVLSQGMKDIYEQSFKGSFYNTISKRIRRLFKKRAL